MSGDAVLGIAIAEAKGAVDQAVAKDPNLTLDDRLRASFAATRHHWMVTDEDARFRAGVGGVLATVEGEDRDRIEAELRQLRGLSAAMAGVPVDFTALLAAEGGAEPIGLLAIWREPEPVR